MIVKPESRSRSVRRGIAALETAVILPFLFLLIFGVWEVGQLVHVNEYVNNSVREGARLGATGNYSGSSVSPTTTFDVQSAVGNYLQNVGLTIPPAGVDITVTNENQNLTMLGTASLDPMDSNKVIITSIATPPSADPVLNANQFDIIRVDVTYPFAFAQWSPNNLFFYTGSNTVVTASTRWCCLRDIAVAVDASIPSAPLQ